MTYNRSEIMRAAWRAYNTFKPFKFCRATFAMKLSQAWAKARQVASIVDLAAHRAGLEQQLESLNYSDALGTMSKMRTIQDQLNSLPKAA